MNLHFISDANIIVIGVSIVVVIFYGLLALWCTKNYKRSVKKEYEEKLEKANSFNERLKYKIGELTKHGNKLIDKEVGLKAEINDLKRKVSNTGVFRNAKGQFQRIQP